MASWCCLAVITLSLRYVVVMVCSPCSLLSWCHHTVAKLRGRHGVTTLFATWLSWCHHTVATLRGRHGVTTLFATWLSWCHHTVAITLLLRGPHCVSTLLLRYMVVLF